MLRGLGLVALSLRIQRLRRCFCTMKQASIMMLDQIQERREVAPSPIHRDTVDMAVEATSSLR